MKAWIARDSKSAESDLFLYFGSIPVRGNVSWITTGGDYVALDSEMYPEITWECEPVEVEVTITIKQQGNE
jgi:hypothetical protein